MPTSEAAAALNNPTFLLAACLLAGLAVGLLVYAGGMALGTGALPATAVIGDAQRRVRRQRGIPDDPFSRLAMSLMPVVVPAARKLPLNSVRASLAERYAHAGWPGGLDDDEVLGLSLVAGLGLALLVTMAILIVKPAAAPVGLLAILLGPMLFGSVLSNTRAKREKSISRTMPFVLDLLVLTMRSGASLPAAMGRVAADFARAPMGIEFQAVLTDLELGVTMRAALESLARRVPLPIVRVFVDDLIQAQELGRPVAETLERLSDRSRIRRVQDAVDTAGKSKVMVMVPCMLILLASLIVLFSPFIVRAFYGGFAEA